MRIINVLDLEFDDILPPLRALADSLDRASSIRGMKLVELVEYLHSRGSSPELCGMFVVDQLLLYTTQLKDRAVWIEIEVPVRGSLADVRFQVRIEDRNRPRSERTSVAELFDVEHLILNAFGWGN